MMALRAWWQSRRLRTLVARVEALERDLRTERALRAREYAASTVAFRWLGERYREQAGRVLDHHAWIAALVETSKSNAGRFRDLTRLHAARVRAMPEAVVPTAETVTPAPAAPLAAVGD